jgi:hypothetical protein
LPGDAVSDRLLRLRFDHELASGLRGLQLQLLSTEPPLLRFDPAPDGRVEITLDLEHLPAEHRDECAATLRQLYHCPREGGGGDWTGPDCPWTGGSCVMRLRSIWSWCLARSQ